MAAAKGRLRGDEDGAGSQRPRLLRDFGEEFRWTLSGRKGWLAGMAINLAFAVVAVRWSDFNPQKTGEIENAILGISVVLYVLAGTVNTNQLGADGERVVAALEGGDSARRLLLGKNLVLAALLVPVAILVSAAFNIVIHRWRLFSHTPLYDIGAVFLWLGIGNIFSVLLPYRPIALRARLRARRTWKRWVIRQAVPYAIYWSSSPLLLLLPMAAIFYFRPFGPIRAVYYPLCYLANGLAVWLLGLWIAAVYARRHFPRLVRELHRPE